MDNDFKKDIEEIALQVRTELESRYGADLAGHCIEASDTIVERLLSQLGLAAETKEGWCRFDDDSYGSDRPWDPHTWVEIPALKLYIDITADQFNYGMFPENEYPKILIREGLPHGMQYGEPNWDILEEDDPSEYATNVISVNDIVHALCECERNARYEGMFEHMLTFASELTGISEDRLYASMQQKARTPAYSIPTVEAQDNSGRNTKITYLYRDADNHQVQNECVFSGVFTDVQKAAILNCLDDGMYFIPSLVGLPETKFDEVDDPVLDHQWFILQEDSFAETTERTTTYTSPSELVAAFQKCKNKWMDLYLGTPGDKSLAQKIRSAREQAGLHPPMSAAADRRERHNDGR